MMTCSIAECWARIRSNSEQGAATCLVVLSIGGYDSAVRPKINMPNRKASLLRRIQQFYRLLNEHRFAQCHRMIDPRVLARSTSVTLLQYQNSLREFLKHFGSMKILEIDIDLHLNEPNRLYEDRDFAIGHTTWQDNAGERHVFSDRWVREGRTWYTRSTGFIKPAMS